MAGSPRLKDVLGFKINLMWFFAVVTGLALWPVAQNQILRYDPWLEPPQWPIAGKELRKVEHFGVFECAYRGQLRSYGYIT